MALRMSNDDRRPFATKSETTNLSLLQQLSIVDERVSISGTITSITGNNTLSMGLFAISLDAICR
jgi:hypothetical protein